MLISLTSTPQEERVVSQIRPVAIYQGNYHLQRKASRGLTMVRSRDPGGLGSMS
jgi:hypothetical protein